MSVPSGRLPQQSIISGKKAGRDASDEGVIVVRRVSERSHRDRVARRPDQLEIRKRELRYFSEGEPYLVRRRRQPGSVFRIASHKPGVRVQRCWIQKHKGEEACCERYSTQTQKHSLEIGQMEITYTTSDCLFGRFLVAQTSKGICMIAIGRSDRELEKRLLSQFPTAMAKRDDRGMASARRAVERRIAGKDLGQKLPLDLHGTPFQVEVWKEMLRIPAGQTRSYAQVATNIGRPKAFRAVAQACGANPVPVVVPCHRVVATNGLGGYTGGIDRKIALLSAEGINY